MAHRAEFEFESFPQCSTVGFVLDWEWNLCPNALTADSVEVEFGSPPQGSIVAFASDFE